MEPVRLATLRLSTKPFLVAVIGTLSPKNQRLIMLLCSCMACWLFTRVIVLIQLARWAVTDYQTDGYIFHRCASIALRGKNREKTQIIPVSKKNPGKIQSSWKQPGVKYLWGIWVLILKWKSEKWSMVKTVKIYFMTYLCRISSETPRISA